jgi:hypothetical protein
MTNEVWAWGAFCAERSRTSAMASASRIVPEGRMESGKKVAASRYTSRFRNRYGEEWVFEYDPAKGEGGLRGSDVDWEEYRVVGGRAEGLILNDDEILWLRKAWAEATGAQ